MTNKLQAPRNKFQTHFELYPEVQSVLGKLQKRGVLLAVISNWQKGLSHFCTELGIRDYFEVIISSAEVGIEKPDARIFEEASHRLRLAPQFILHVGDQEIEDFIGAQSAGFRSVLSCRERKRDNVDSIASLTEIEDMVDESPGRNSC
jgi:putative hydrolase of the HAD superfamily